MMFVNIVAFPPIKEGRDADFRDWFAWSNAQYSKFEGFISRRLLKPQEGGTYVAIVEHESHDTFMAMHTSPAQAEAAVRVKSLLDGSPSPRFFDVVVG